MSENKEDFSALLDEFMGKGKSLQGTVVKGTIVALNDDFATIDVGLKSEGRLAIKELGLKEEPKVGDTLEIIVVADFLV